MAWRPNGDDVRRWIGLCAAGEILGVAAAALWYAAIDRAFGTPDDLVQRIPVWFFLALAGLIEGAILGALQATALQRIYPELRFGLWLNLTILIAIAGWGLGAAVHFFASAAGLGEVVPGQALAAAAAAGALIGAVFGAAQAFALREAAHRAWIWIPANALGWALALPIIWAAAMAVPAGAGWAQVALAGFLAGGGAGLALGLVTSAAFPAMPPRAAVTAQLGAA